MSKTRLLFYLFLFVFAFASCENPMMIAILGNKKPNVPNNGTEPEFYLAGSAVIASDDPSGLFKIGSKLTIDTSSISIMLEDEEHDIDSIEGSFIFQWYRDDERIEEPIPEISQSFRSLSEDASSYTVQAADVDTVISCVVTHSEVSGSIEIEGQKIPFTLKIDLFELDESDAVSFKEDFDFEFDYTGAVMEETAAVSGSELALYYKLKGSYKYNEIVLMFGLNDTEDEQYITAEGVDIDGEEPHLYTVNPLDAANGIIIIRAGSRHSDKEFLDKPSEITFSKNGEITFIPGANNEDAGCTYSYRLIDDKDESVYGHAVNKPMTADPIPDDPDGRYKAVVPDIADDMLKFGNGGYFVRIRAETENDEFDNESLLSEPSNDVYVQNLTVTVEGSNSTDRVNVNTGGEKYYHIEGEELFDAESDFAQTFTINVYRGTDITLTAIHSAGRFVTWKDAGTHEADAYVITGIAANTAVTVIFDGEETDDLPTDPDVTWPGGVIVNKGDELNDAMLTGGSASYDGSDVPGTFQWAFENSPTDTIGVHDDIAVKFTPNDITSYNEVLGTVSVTVKAPQGIESLIFNPISDVLSWTISGNPITTPVVIQRSSELQIVISNPSQYSSIEWILNPNEPANITISGSKNETFKYKSSNSADYTETDVFTLTVKVKDTNGVPYNRTIIFKVNPDA